MTGSALSLPIPSLGMSSSVIPESPSAARTQFLRRRHWPSPILQGLGTLDAPTTIEWAHDFGTVQNRVYKKFWVSLSCLFIS